MEIQRTTFGTTKQRPDGLTPHWEDRHIGKIKSQAGHYYDYTYADPHVTYQRYILSTGEYQHVLRFSLTFETLRGDWWLTSCGAFGHEAITKSSFSRLDLKMLLSLEKWHLWDFYKGAMHYEANALYWHKLMLASENQESFDKHLDTLKSHINYGASILDYGVKLETATQEEMKFFLVNRLPYALGAMHWDINEAIQTITKGTETIADYLPLEPLWKSRLLPDGTFPEQH